MKTLFFISFLFLPMLSSAQYGGSLKIQVIAKGEAKTPLDSVKITAVTSGRDTLVMYTDSTGQCYATLVWKGIYHLTVEKNGYATLIVKGIGVINNETTYLTGPYAIKLSPIELNTPVQEEKKKGRKQ